MSLVRLEVDENEITDMLTELYHKTGYLIEKKDPIVAEYLMHKIILRQFLDHQSMILRHFTETYLPHLRKAEENFEAGKVAFTEYAETTQKDVLKSMMDSYNKIINNSLNQISKAILDNLKAMLAQQHDQEDKLLASTREEHRRFQATANRFEKHLLRAAYIVGGSVAFCGLLTIFYLTVL